MAFDSGNFLVIGSADASTTGPFFVQERENNNGKPGKIVTFADGKGDVNEVAKGYIEDGFDPKKIIINGQLASDVFTKNSTDAEAVDVKKAPLDDKEALRRFLVYQNSSPLAMALDKDFIETIKYKFGRKKDN